MKRLVRNPLIDMGKAREMREGSCVVRGIVLAEGGEYWFVMQVNYYKGNWDGSENVSN